MLEQYMCKRYNFKYELCKYAANEAECLNIHILAVNNKVKNISVNNENKQQVGQVS